MKCNLLYFLFITARLEPLAEYNGNFFYRWTHPFKYASLDVDEIIKLNADKTELSNCWIIRFIKERSCKAIITTVYRYKKNEVLLFDARQLKSECRTANRLICIVDADLDLLSPDDIDALGSLLRGMTNEIRLTFDVVGNASLEKFPVDAVPRAGRIDVDGRRGWLRYVDLFAWYTHRLIAVDLSSVSWHCLESYYDEIIGNLIITTHQTRDYNRFMHVLVVAKCRQFDLRLLNEHGKTVARWQKTRTQTNRTRTQSLVVSLLHSDHAKLLAKHVLLGSAKDFGSVDVVTDQMDNIFVPVYNELRLALEPLDRYTVREVAHTSNVNRRAANERPHRMRNVSRVDVNGKHLIAKLAPGISVVLPNGKRFTSIDLDVGATLEQHRDEAMAIAEWLTQCWNVKYLHVLDHGAGILAYTIQLATAERMKQRGKRC